MPRTRHQINLRHSPEWAAAMDRMALKLKLRTHTEVIDQALNSYADDLGVSLPPRTPPRVYPIPGCGRKKKSESSRNNS